MVGVEDTDVIIGGAGAAGLTLAVDLARRQVRFLLIDKAPHPFVGSRGKGIQPRSQEVFEDLGVLDRIVASGGEYPVQRSYTEDGSVDRPAVELSEATVAEPYQIPLLVPQFLTERRLRERLTELGHAPRYGHELVGFEQDGDGVSARPGLAVDDAPSGPRQGCAGGRPCAGRARDRRCRSRHSAVPSVPRQPLDPARLRGRRRRRAGSTRRPAHSHHRPSRRRPRHRWPRREHLRVVPGQWVLVRPDGYVACVVDTDAIGSVEDNLDIVGVRRPR